LRLVLAQFLFKAFAHPKLEAVLLSVNSPGGSAVQSELIAEYVTSKAADKKVAVLSFVEDMAASGGYWLAAAGQKIFVTRSSIVGSIGIYNVLAMTSFQPLPRRRDQRELRFP